VTLRTPVVLKLAGIVDLDKILQELSGTSLELNGHSISFERIFESISENLACGLSSELRSLIRKIFGLTEAQLWEYKGNLHSEVLGKLVILGLVRVQPAVGEWSDVFYLTDLGKDLSFKIRCQSKKNQNE